MAQQRVREPMQICGSCVAASSGGASIGQRRRVRLPYLPTGRLGIADCEIRRRALERLGARRGHTSRHIDVLANKIVVVLATDLLDQSAEEHEPVIAVSPL